MNIHLYYVSGMIDPEKVLPRLDKVIDDGQKQIDAWEKTVKKFRVK